MIIESLGLCYHLHCFKVSLSQRACWPTTPRHAPPCHALLGERMASTHPWGCGCATNELGAITVICAALALQMACYYLVLKPGIFL